MPSKNHDKEKMRVRDRRKRKIRFGCPGINRAIVCEWDPQKPDKIFMREKGRSKGVQVSIPSAYYGLVEKQGTSKYSKDGEFSIQTSDGGNADNKSASSDNGFTPG